mgnify:CR=1 FL=1
MPQNDANKTPDYSSVAVIIPCYNEAVTIAKVVDDFHRVLPEATVYVYDNNSADGTGQIAREHGAVVRLETRQGKGNVVRQMMRDIDADYYIKVDGDDTYPAIHAVDKGWRIAQIPIDYRDRPEGSESKLNTVSDGIKVLRMIMSLFKDYKPFALFGWLTLIFFVIGLICGIPLIVEFGSTGLVPRIPTAILTIAFMMLSALSLVCGLILDTVVKGNRKEYELRVIDAYQKYTHSQI